MVNLKLEEQIGEEVSPEPRSQGRPVLAVITWRRSPVRGTAGSEREPHAVASPTRSSRWLNRPEATWLGRLRNVVESQPTQEVEEQGRARNGSEGK